MGNRFKVNGRWTESIVFLLAFLLKASLVQYFLVMDGDRSMQMDAAINLAHGHGYTILQTSVSDLNKASYSWLTEWPPLYSCFLVPVLWSTGFNELLSFSIVDTVFVFFYLYSIWKLLKWLDFPAWVRWSLLFFKAAELNSAIYNSFATDIPAAACIFFAIGYFLQWQDNGKRSTAVLTGIFLLAAFCFRLQYIISLAAIPLLTGWNGLLKKNRKNIQHAILMGLIIYTGIGFYFLLNHLQAGQITYGYIREYGIFPRNLLLLAPLFWCSFADVLFMAVQIDLRTSLTYGTAYALLMVSSWPFVLYMAGRWFWQNLQLKFLFPLEKHKRFFQVAGLISIMVAGSLLYLSLRHKIKLDPGMTGGWTYVLEDRYFMVPVTIMLFGIADVLFVHRLFSKRITVILRIAYFSACFVLVTHALWFLVKNLNAPKTSYSFAAKDTEHMFPVISDLSKLSRDSGLEMVLITDDYGNMHKGLQEGAKLFRYPNLLQVNPQLNLSAPSLVVITFSTTRRGRYEELVSKYGFRQYAVLENDLVYIKLINNINGSKEVR